MARDLRVPLLFGAPRDWEIGDPDAVGAPEAAFASRSPESERGHHPTICVADVFARHDGPAEVARRSAAGLLRVGDVEVRARTDEPGRASFRQSLALTVPTHGELLDLVQDQVYREFTDPGTGRGAVVAFVLTSTPAMAETSRAVFDAFLRTVRLGDRAWLWS